MFCRLADFADGAEHGLESANCSSIVGVLARVSAIGHGAMQMLSAERRPFASSRRRTGRGSGADLSQQLPHLLGEERHHRVQQPQQHVERVGQHALGGRAAARRRAKRALVIST